MGRSRTQTSSAYPHATGPTTNEMQIGRRVALCRKPHDGRGDAWHEDIDAGGLAAPYRALQRREKLIGGRHELAVSAERLDDVVVPGPQELAAMGALRAIGSELHLMLGVSSRIVSDHRHEGEPVADGGVELGHVESKRAVARQRDDRRLRVGGSRSERKRDGSADRAGDPVDDAPGRADQAVPPLAISPPSQMKSGFSAARSVRSIVSLSVTGSIPPLSDEP